MSSVAVASPRSDRLEWVILCVGLALCIVSLTVVALSLQPATLLEGTAALQRFHHVSETVILPLGMVTSMLSLAALLRLWNLSSRRGRLRLASVLLLMVVFLFDLIIVGPLVDRLLAATDPLSVGVASDMQQLQRFNLLRGGLVILIAISLVAAHRAPVPLAVESSNGFTVRHRTLLLMVGTATLFEGYDRFIASLALPYIGHDLGAGEGALGYALAVIRVGALASIFFGRFADRYGRRKLLIASVVAYTVATAATGFSYGLLDFAMYQLVATIFLTTETTLAQVVIAEEFPTSMRGFGQGMLGAFSAFGSGLAAMLFPILQRTSFGWRGMYLIGVLPLLVMANLQRNLPETQRWKRAHGDEANSRAADLLNPRWRTALLVLVVLAGIASATGATAFSFASYRATTAMEWNPGQVSGMILGGGAIGFFGYFLFGRLADVFGRRRIGALGVIGGSIAAVLYYQTTSLLPAFALLTFSDSAVVIALNSLGTELFPTHLRATAKSWITNSATIGALVGLAAVGVLSNVAGGHATVITILAGLLLLHAPLFFLLPETSQAELEEIEPV